MYKVGDKLTLKCSHGLLKQGEMVTVVEVNEINENYYWAKVMSINRYGYDALLSVRKGEEEEIAVNHY